MLIVVNPLSNEMKKTPPGRGRAGVEKWDPAHIKYRFYYNCNPTPLWDGVVSGRSPEPR
jgi:hypothetical protein